MTNTSALRADPAERCSGLPLVPGLRALQVHPKAGRYELVIRRTQVCGRNKHGMLGRCVPSGSDDTITFFPCSRSRGMSLVRMAPGSPFSPCNSENLSMKWGLLLTASSLGSLAPAVLQTRPPPLPPHCFDITCHLGENCSSLSGVLSGLFPHTAQDQAGVLQAPPPFRAPTAARSASSPATLQDRPGEVLPTSCYTAPLRKPLTPNLFGGLFS